MSDGGKGSKPRPFCVSQEEYDNRWDNIFGRDKPKDVVKVPPVNLDGEREQHILETIDHSNLLNK
jgi:hypothetical protein